MQERISLTRSVARHMLSSKPWHKLILNTNTREGRRTHTTQQTLRHSPAALPYIPSVLLPCLLLYAAVAVQRLHNILVLFPDLLDRPQSRNAVFSILSLLCAHPPSTTTASSPPTVYSLYYDALLARIIALIPRFTSAQQRVIRQQTAHFEHSATSISALACLRLSFTQSDPFSSLHLSPHCLSCPPHLPLVELPRLPCPSCSRLQPFCCSRCVRVVHPLAAAAIPRVALPFHLHIVLHPEYERERSTALPLQLLCPASDITVHVFPRLPAFTAHCTRLLFPAEDAEEAVPVLASLNSLSSVTDVVLLEGTWPQCASMARDKCLSALPAVRLPASASSCFWRWHEGQSAGCVSSVEAVWMLATGWPQEEVAARDTLDDLLWLFALSWRRMQQYYCHDAPQLLPPPLSSAIQFA